jgi:hypothetical protein
MVGACLLVSAFVRGGPEALVKPRVLKIEPFGTIAEQIKFRGDELATVIASSRRGTDVDLYIFDEAGNLVAWDDSPLDGCAVEWLPERTAGFAYVVRNTSPGQDTVEIVVPTTGRGANE